MNKDKIRILLRESAKKSKELYQIRYIDGPVFYNKSDKGDTWKFITAEEFVNNVCDGELVKWDEKD
jgi:hypothetical protein